MEQIFEMTLMKMMVTGAVQHDYLKLDIYDL